MRSGCWKLYLSLEGKLIDLSGDYSQGRHSPVELYNLDRDIEEEREVSGQHPDVIRHLTVLTERIRRDIGDEDRAGKYQRPAGFVDNPTPRLKAVKLF